MDYNISCLRHGMPLKMQDLGCNHCHQEALAELRVRLSAAEDESERLRQRGSSAANSAALDSIASLEAACSSEYAEHLITRAKLLTAEAECERLRADHENAAGISRLQWDAQCARADKAETALAAARRESAEANGRAELAEHDRDDARGERDKASQEAVRLRSGIMAAFQYASHRWEEWGSRALAVAEILDATLDGREPELD